MREILFRGKSGSKWAYGDLWHLNDGRVTIRKDGEIFPYEVIPDTVGQYTGLTDKNGNRIFEGDIVNDEQSGYNYFIKWFPEYACFALANKNGHIEFGCDELEIFLDDLVVIGNIHDNPDLLKGE